MCHQANESSVMQCVECLAIVIPTYNISAASRSLKLMIENALSC